MEDARRWWESKQKELQKSIDELLKRPGNDKKEILTIMMEMVNKAKIKED